MDGRTSASNPDRVAYEQRTAIVSTVPWIQTPAHLLVLHGTRGFNVRVDPTALPEGLHYGEIQIVDTVYPTRCG